MWLRSDHVEMLERVWPCWMPLAAIEREHDFVGHLATLELLKNLEDLGFVESALPSPGGTILEREWRITSEGLHAALENAGRVL